MDLLCGIAFIASFSLLFAVWSCRASIALGHKPSSFLALAVPAFVSSLTVLLMFGTELFTRQFWIGGKSPMFDDVTVVFGIPFLVGIVPAWRVVVYYQHQMEVNNENKPPESLGLCYTAHFVAADVRRL